MTNESSDRPIDRIRKSALSMQKILSLGAQDPEVARTFLTAHALFKSQHLGAQFEEEKALQFAFDFLTDIAAMIEMHKSLDLAIEAAMTKFDALPAQDRSVRLPSLEDASDRCDAFMQKIGHAVDTLERIARLFHPEELKKKWVDSLTSFAAKKHGQDSGLARFMREAGPTLLFLQKLRNMVEHPQDGARITVYDFMEQVRNKFVAFGEMLIGQLAGANVQTFSAFPIFLIELPEERRPKSNPHQRLSYGIEIHGKVQPFGHGG